MHKPYQEVFKHLPDFEITYHILSPEEGGSKMPAFQGIRWDFTYEEYPSERFMIYPEIIDVSTNGIFAPGIPIPKFGMATMWVLNPQLHPVHQKRIKVGVRGIL
ncbi:hypothetical protein GO730_22425 [Spirosoma sp. HMF3257]|uniref:Uncharacterized protein n=1 Tax=Spirosoma telluris TaxID=2183553 RepID=A0A327NR16_9BACT|nr:hypothetical protein [Spirosoma telluris]RAI76234.1 hypothetical protein HMF3257_22370 [Spirosoma telluris]